MATDLYELAAAIYVAHFANGKEIVPSVHERLAEQSFAAAEAFRKVERERVNKAASGKFKPHDPPSFAQLGEDLG